MEKRTSSINTVSHDAPTVSARFIYGSITIHGGSAAIHHGGATNAHEFSRCSHDSIRCCTNQASGATTSSLYFIRDESLNLVELGFIGVSVIPRFTPIVHQFIYGAATNEPDAATVELRFRPRPQSTTIHHESFKRFKIVVALSVRFPNHQDSSRITAVLLRFTPTSLRCYYESCRCIPI